MQSDNGSDTISFETFTPQIMVFLKEKSFGTEQPKTEEANGAVENHPSSETDKKVKKNQRKTNTVRKSRLNWSQDQELEYFYATIKFSIENPYLTTSWQWRKPDRFFKFISAHMEDIFGKEKARTARQCKPKDQIFKKIYFDVAQQRKDLIQISIYMLIGFIADTQEELSNQIVKCQQKVERVDRYDAILKKYYNALKETKTPKDYEKSLTRLGDYSKKMNPIAIEILESL